MIEFKKDHSLTIDDIEFIYRDKSVKQACKIIDEIIGKQGSSDDFETVYKVYGLFRQEIDPEIEDKLSSLFLYAIRSRLKENRLSDKSRFRHYLLNEALVHYFSEGNKPIEITDKIKEKVHRCSCGHKPKVTIRYAWYRETGVVIQCPCCGIIAKQSMITGNTLYGGNYYLSMKKMVCRCINAWSQECKKELSYVALELLISEFAGRMDVTDKVRKYSRALLEYVTNNGLDKNYPVYDSAYRQEMPAILYKDKTAMKIVNEFLRDPNR